MVCLNSLFVCDLQSKLLVSTRTTAPAVEAKQPKETGGAAASASGVGGSSKPSATSVKSTDMDDFGDDDPELAAALAASLGGK